MGRRNIGQLSKPKVGSDVTRPREGALSGFGFETKAQAKEEDAKRIKALRRLSSRPKSERGGLRKGALRIVGANIKGRHSLASSMYMRRHRRRIINAVYALARQQDRELVMVNLLPSGFRFSGGQLHRADPHKLLERLRIVLLRHNSNNSGGWLIGFLDGEFEPSSNHFVLHFHGLATADYGDVLSRARKASKLFRVDTVADQRQVRAPIRIMRNLTNLPRVTGYCFMAFWPERYRGVTSEGAELHERRKRRISEPFHSEYLSWLSRYQIQDLCLLVGLRIDQNGNLKPTR